MSALVNKVAGRAPWLVMVLVVFTAKVCLAQPLHRPLQPRQGVAPHPSAAAIGGPTRAADAATRAPRFPVVPAGSLIAKAPPAPREFRNVAAKPVEAPVPPPRSQDPHKRQGQLSRQNHAAPSHGAK